MNAFTAVTWSLIIISAINYVRIDAYATVAIKTKPAILHGYPKNHDCMKEYDRVTMYTIEVMNASLFMPN